MSAPDTAVAAGSTARWRRVQSVETGRRAAGRRRRASPRGSTAAELALACGINRATAWRLLATLEGRGLVDRDPATNRYQIGYTVARLAAASGVDGLVRRTHHVLERICAQTGEAADLAVGRRSGLVYVDEVAPPAVLTVNWLARPVPLHATSTGKAWLAWLPEPRPAVCSARCSRASPTPPSPMSRDCSAELGQDPRAGLCRVGGRARARVVRGVGPGAAAGRGPAARGVQHLGAMPTGCRRHGSPRSEPSPSRPPRRSKWRCATDGACDGVDRASARREAVSYECGDCS